MGPNKYKGVAGKTDLLAGLGAVGYSFMPGKKMSPLRRGGRRVHVGQSEARRPERASTSTKFAYTGGAGLGFKLNSTVNFWLEGRLIGTKDAKLIPVSAGFTFNFGKKSM